MPIAEEAEEAKGACVLKGRSLCFRWGRSVKSALRRASCVQHLGALPLSLISIATGQIDATPETWAELGKHREVSEEDDESVIR